jgi:hypothetical protein
MARNTCLVCLVGTVSGLHKNTLGRASTSSGHITKFEQSTFHRYLCKLAQWKTTASKINKNDIRYTKAPPHCYLGWDTDKIPLKCNN